MTYPTDERFAHLWKDFQPWQIYSQWGEDSIIEIIFSKIDTANKWCCECGAADGLWFSNTRRLIEQGWSAVLIEADRDQYERLTALYQGNSDVSCWNYLVSPDKASFDEILSDKNAPIDLDLLVIDVDGQDYYLWNSVLKYSPRVVVCEASLGGDPDFIPTYGGEGQAGYHAIIKLAFGKLYYPVCRTKTNVICVRQDLAHLLDEKPEASGDSSLESSRHRCPHGGTMGDYFREGSCQCCGQIGTPVIDEVCRICATPSIEVTPSDPPITGYANVSSLRNGRLNGMAKSAPQRSTGSVGAAMSTPRIGFLHNSDCILTAFAELGITLTRGEGVFWHQALTRAIEKQLSMGVEFILTCDYDTVFTAKDIAKLWAFLDDNPQIDVACAIQQKREGGALLATTIDGLPVDMSQPGVPIGYGHFGLTMFRSRAFEKLHKPWFYEAPDAAGGWDEGRVDADIGFWKNCMASGVVVYQANTVIVGHLEQVVTYPDQNLNPLYVPVNRWRNEGAPIEAFNYKQARSEAVALDMG